MALKMCIRDRDFSVQKASFLRLSALTLAYTFPTKVINALKLTNPVSYTHLLINGPLEAIEEMDIKDQKLNRNSD